MHASTRILLLMAASAVLVGGAWILFQINEVALATAYSAAWALVVLVATRIVLGVGSGYNSLRARRAGRTAGSGGAATALAELNSLRSDQLISEQEYDAKRATVMERL